MTAPLTARTRAMAMPAPVQSLSTTAGLQDVVPLGLAAARRARDILANVACVVAFELLCACQAADARGPEGLSAATRPLYERVRELARCLDLDVTITDCVEALAEALLDGTLTDAPLTDTVLPDTALTDTALTDATLTDTALTDTAGAELPAPPGYQAAGSWCAGGVGAPPFCYPSLLLRGGRPGGAGARWRRRWCSRSRPRLAGRAARSGRRRRRGR